MFQKHSTEQRSLRRWKCTQINLIAPKTTTVRIIFALDRTDYSIRISGRNGNVWKEGEQEERERERATDGPRTGRLRIYWSPCFRTNGQHKIGEPWPALRGTDNPAPSMAPPNVAGKYCASTDEWKNDGWYQQSSHKTLTAWNNSVTPQPLHAQSVRASNERKMRASLGKKSEAVHENLRLQIILKLTVGTTRSSWPGAKRSFAHLSSGMNVHVSVHQWPMTMSQLNCNKLTHPHLFRKLIYPTHSFLSPNEDYILGFPQVRSFGVL